MVVFSDKATFTTLGLEPITPSPTHLSQDCHICTHPLDVTPTSTATSYTLAHTTAHLRQPHAAVRIIACSHMHGAQCLTAWLEVSNTCPTCKRLLFEQSARSEITNADVHAVVESLAPQFGARDVLVAVHQCVAREGGALLQEKLYREEKEGLEREEKTRAQEEVAGDGEWLVSDDEEMEFEFGEDEDEDEESEEIDYGEDENEIEMNGYEASD
jgi:hypothetical protein